MTALRQEIFVCLDKIVEIAAARFTFEKIVQEIESLINPECEIPSISQEIHKISQEMVANKPKIKEVLPDLLKMIDGHILVGHGIGFDIALIAAEAKRNQIPCNIHQLRFIDTLRLARLYGESPVNSLEQLRKHFNIQPEGVHRAMSDVIVNIEVFKFLTKNYQTTEQVFKALEKPIKLRAMPLGKHKGRRFEEIPVEYLLWAERKDFDQDLLFSIRSELRNRKRGGGFEQSGNPFANL